MQMKSGWTFASLVAGLGICTAAHANLLTNGSFEDQTVPVQYSATTNMITGWDTQLGAGPYDGVQVANANVAGKDGNNYLIDSFDVADTDPAYRPAVTAGQSLNLSLLYSPHADNAGTYFPTPVYLDYYDASGTLLQSDNVINFGSGAPTDSFYSQSATDVVPTGAVAVGVRIVAPTQGYNDSDLIDNVQLNVAATPEPASLGLVGVAALLLGRRRRTIA